MTGGGVRFDQDCSSEDAGAAASNNAAEQKIRSVLAMDLLMVSAPGLEPGTL